MIVSAAGAIAFALSNPDGRIASRNVDRYLAGGRIDGAYLRAPERRRRGGARAAPPRPSASRRASARTCGPSDGLARGQRRALAGPGAPSPVCALRRTGCPY